MEKLLSELASLKKELEEQKESTAAPGNPYITALSGKVSGMEAVLSEPAVKAIPELIGFVEMVLKEQLEHGEGGDRVYVNQASEIIYKIKGAK